MNSTSATATPARRAMAMPSPVERAGFVVTAKHCPAPPVATTVWRARTSETTLSGARAVTPAARPPSTRSSSASQPSRTSAGVASTAATSARSISAPVASPPACSTRAAECPPSRASARPAASPSPVWSNTAPMAMSSRTRSGPSVTSTRTASGSQRPAPAAIVSDRCSSGESSGPTSRAAATPPWAYRVAECASSPLVSTRTDQPAREACTAPDKPAIPLPSTSRSNIGPSHRGVTCSRSELAQLPVERLELLIGRTVARVDLHDLRRVRLELRLVVLGVADDDHAVARVHEAGGGAVEDDVAATAADDVRLEAGAVVDVEHVHLLVLEQVGELHEARVEGDRAHVVQVRAGDGRPVDLGLHHRAVHQLVCSCVASVITPRSTETSAPAICIVTLSIRRARPTGAATATRTSPSSSAMGVRSAARRTSAYSCSRPWRAVSASR